jgi:hypothetical protein
MCVFPKVGDTVATVDNVQYLVVDLMLYERQVMLRSADGLDFPVKMHEIDRICG